MTRSATWSQSARVHAMNQYYDNIVDRHTVNMRFYNELSVVSIPTNVQLCTVTAYFVKLLIILAEMCRKKMEAMKESERTRTMNGSLWSTNKLDIFLDGDWKHLHPEAGRIVRIQFKHGVR